MNWKLVTLNRDDINSSRHVSLQEAFENVFMAASAPMAAAMFENDPSHDEYGYYFSPRAVAIFGIDLDANSAEPCLPPPRTNTSLLVGHADAFVMLQDEGSKE